MFLSSSLATCLPTYPPTNSRGPSELCNSDVSYTRTRRRRCPLGCDASQVQGSQPTQKQLASCQFARPVLCLLVPDVLEHVLVLLAHASTRAADRRFPRADLYHPARLRPPFVSSQPSRKRHPRARLRISDADALLSLAPEPRTAPRQQRRPQPSRPGGRRRTHGRRVSRPLEVRPPQVSPLSQSVS